MHPAVQIDEPILQPGLVLLPRNAIDSWGGFPLQSVKAFPQEADRQVVEQRRELRTWLLFRDSPHTR
jgi:hypothetical protein